MFVKEVGYVPSSMGKLIAAWKIDTMVSCKFIHDSSKAYTSHLLIELNMLGMGRDEEKLVKYI